MITPVTDEVLDELSDRNEGLDVADVIDELRALRKVADAAERVYAEPTGYVEKAEAWDDFAAALRDAGRLP